MNADDLRFFLAVAENGAMNRAASELNTVQSNVTARIQALEGELSTKLFDRSSKGVSLTDAGKRLLPYASQVLNLLEEAERATRDNGNPGGPLVIGSLETTAALRLAPCLASFISRFPEVDLNLKTGTTCELIEGVLEHRLEGAFVCGPVDHPELMEEPIFEEELVLLTAPGINDLQQALAVPSVRIVVLRIGCSYRLILEDLLAQRGIVGTRTMEFGTLEAVFACVSAGLGITLLPRGLVGRVWKEGAVAVHRLDCPGTRVETVFISRRGAYQSSARKAFLSHVGTRLREGLAAE